MANLYVRSTDGSNADSGATWALAKAGVSGASAIDAAGDVVYLSQAHAESNASSSNAWAGTNANPVRVLGGDDAAAPPTALSTAPTITVSGTTWSWQGAVYTYGVTFIFSSGSAWGPAFNDSSNFKQTFKDCKFRVDGAGGSTALIFGTSSGGGSGETELIDCTIRLGASGQRIYVNRDLYIRGGSWESGGTNPASIFTMTLGSRPSFLLMEGFDFSNLATTTNLIGTFSDGGAKAIFRNCKLPASWTGAPVASGQNRLGSRVEMHNCDSGDTNYKLWIESYEGSIRDETTIVRSGGASDGTTALTWKMVSSANVAYPNGALASPEYFRWNDTVGSSVTVTIETVTDNVTLTDAECWIDVQYLGTSGVPLSLFVNDAKADVLATAASQTSSSETWTTTGLTTPVKQKLSVSFTPQEKGFIIARVKLAKASTTVYVDPKLTVT